MNKKPRMIKRGMTKRVELRKGGEFLLLAEARASLSPNRSQMSSHLKKLPKSHPDRTTQLLIPARR